MSVKTYWPEIRALEDHLEKEQDAAALIDFIKRLESKGLLHPDMFHAICEASGDTNKRWIELHSFAKESANES